MEEYFCPNCGAILNEQPGFDPDDGSWACKTCNMMLMDEDVFDGEEYEGVAWFCDSCGALLNRQHRFSDSLDYWTCTECYYKNRLSDDDIYSSQQEYEGFTGESVKSAEDIVAEKISDGIVGLVEGVFNFLFIDQSDEENDDIEEEDDATNSISEEVEHPKVRDELMKTLNASKNTKSDEKVVNEFSSVDDPSEKKATFVAAVVVVLISMLVFVGAFVWYEYSLLTEIPFSMGSVLDKDYEEVVADFEEAGFTNVWEYEFNDLSISEEHLENLVVGVKIGWDEVFDERDKYPSNWPITIYYHTVQTIKVPLTSKEAKEMNYIDVINAFEEAGFINVETEVEYDVITGWIAKEGDVKSVTINGNEYEEYDDFRPDVDVIITYHDLRSNRPK